MNIIDVSFAGLETEIEKSRVEEICEEVLAYHSLNKTELSIVFCDDKFIRVLNKNYRNINEPTDVLSFETIHPAADEKIHHIGDIVISLDTVIRGSKEYGVEPNEELKRCIIHGILHLIGYNHTNDSVDQEMISLQEKIVNKLRRVRLL